MKIRSLLTIIALSLIITGCGQNVSVTNQLSNGTQQNEAETTKQIAVSSGDNDDTTNSQKIFAIPELGIEMTTDADLANDITYTIQTYAQGHKAAILSTNNLNKLSHYCITDGIALISKYSIDPNINRRANGQYELDQTRLKKIDDFYITYTHPTSVCTSNEKDMAYLTNITDKIKESFSTVTAIK